MTLSALLTHPIMAITMTGANFDSAVKPIVSLINSLLNPALAIVGALGALYCILLGVKFAKAEEPQEHEKAKHHLKNAIIGFVLIFVLMFALKAGMGIMINWYNANPVSDMPAINGFASLVSGR